MNEAVRVIATGASAAAPQAWIADMIRPLSDAGVGTQAPFVRQSFEISGTGPATLRISALGLYRAFINGQRVGNDLLTPGWTCYDARLSYQTYEVGDLLKRGTNVIDIWLADGWLRSQMMWAKNPIFNTWGSEIGAIAELRQGNALVVKTDASWKSGLLPVLHSGIYYGEDFDARQDQLAATSGTGVIQSFAKSTLLPHETTPVRELAALPVVSSWTDDEGRLLYDFGQNAAGYVAFTVDGDIGAKIIVEHSEILDQTRNLDNANYRSAPARVEYTLKGNGPESYKPYFTFFGFRYVRITAIGRANITAIESVPISSAQHVIAGFTSANPLVDRLFENTIWSQRSNFIEAPTDCPQRDERLGWTGDAQVFSPTACYLNDSESFLRKWMRDVMVDQRPSGQIAHVTPDPTRNHEDKVPGFFGSTGWGDAICVIPWVLYEHYGDKGALAETLPAMVKWVDYVWSISNGPIVMPPRAWDGRGFTFGDWLQPKGPSEKPLPTIGDDAAATIYLYISSALTAQAARVLGNTAIAERMEQRAAEVKAAFQREFIAPSGRLVYDDQTSYALAILHDLIPAAQLPAAARYFKSTIARADGRIGTGFIGTPALLPALIKIGEPELAAQVFLQEEVPGWLYQVKTGATTIWERWDAIRADGTPFDPAMNSYNHYAYGAICQWLLEAVAGFRPDAANPAFEHIIFEPTIIPALSPVRAHHDSRAGRIEAGWTVDGDKVVYDITVPAGGKGTLVMSPRYGDIAIDGKSGASGAALAPGQHTITFQITAAA
jgi:alpha-L-rhamnosidase